MSAYTFKLPDLGEGTVESEIGEWFIKVGDQVKEEDVVATMMTDKAAVEISSPVTGKVVSLAGEPGDIVAVGAALVVFESDADNSSETPPAEVIEETPVEKPAVSAPPAGALKLGRAVTSPAVRRMAKEAGIDLTTVAGSGPNGRIRRGDLEAHMQQQSPTSAPLQAEAGSKEIKVIGLRRMIAERMTASKTEIPHFSYVEEIDITGLEALRKHLNASRVDKADRLTVLPFISMALVRALKDFPQCNATYDKNRNVIVQHGNVNLGIATQTPDGLKVPVVKNAGILSVDMMANEIRRVSEAARSNRATKDELTGSTITLTSLGKLGGIVTTPVINLPEVAIIGVNRAVERPVVKDGEIQIRTMMNLSSSFDHRFVDGFDAAAMIQRIKDMLEHPSTIFI